MMSDLEAGFANSIFEDPSDPAVWPALADYLEETDRPARAALLRLWLKLRGSSRYKNRAADEAQIAKWLRQGVEPAVPRTEVSHGIRLALIPAGTFRMGSVRREPSRRDDEYRHEVTLTRPFWMGCTTVTQAQYRAVTGKSPAHHTPSRIRGVEDTSDFPVEMVSWDHAVDFCRRLGRLKAERQAGRTYRLPTEAEWEYACRGAGTVSTQFHFGNAASPRLVNYDSTGRAGFDEDDEGDVDHDDSYIGRPCPVSQYPPNAVGLYDMHGNVWEWCADWYADDYFRRSPKRDPKGPETGDGRVLRGGCWVSDPHYLRCARRYQSRDGYRVNMCFGFRVVMEPTG